MSGTRTRRVAAVCACMSLLLFCHPSLADVSKTKAREELVWNVKTQQRVIALTFDDGPDIAYTPQILDLLKKYHAAATFFVVGKSVEKYPDIARREVLEGHELANHTYSHPLMRQISEPQLHDELVKTNEIIRKTTGQVPHYFRPPNAFYNEMIINTAKQSGFRIVMWSSQDTRDWSRPGVQKIVDSVVHHVQNGSIVLLHDYGGDRSQTVAALAKILPELERRGYQFVTLSELLHMNSDSREHVK